MREIFRLSVLPPLFALALLSTVTVTFGQDEGAIKVETNLVSVGVSVYDRRGDYVKGLKKGNFKVFDNGREQEIALFSSEAAPVLYGFVYDLHPTTSERTKTILSSIKEFTKELPEKDDFFTIVFNQRGSLDLGFVPTVEQVNRHLSLGERGEPNSLYDAIALAAEKSVRRPNAKRTLIVITDGKDDDSHHSFRQLSEKLQGINVQIFAIFVGDQSDSTFSDLSLNEQPRRLDEDRSLDRAAINELARRSGGDTQEPFTENELDLLSIYNRIGIEMNNQYSLGFYPAKTDGKWHKLSVEVSAPSAEKGFRLAYRKGYQSPATAQ